MREEPRASVGGLGARGERGRLSSQAAFWPQFWHRVISGLRGIMASPAPDLLPRQRPEPVAPPLPPQLPPLERYPAQPPPPSRWLVGPTGHPNPLQVPWPSKLAGRCAKPPSALPGGGLAHRYGTPNNPARGSHLPQGIPAEHADRIDRVRLFQEMEEQGAFLWSSPWPPALEEATEEANQ